MSDIKFDGEWVIIEGNWLKVTTLDLMLDNAGRRRTTGGHRRALVHDSSDGLTVNYAGDYPGGVTINGNVSFTGRLKGNYLRVECNDIMLDQPSRRSSNTGWRRALVHDFSDGLTINWANDYPGGVTINGNVKCPGNLKVGVYDIESTIANLQNQINQLKARVAALES